MPDALTETCPQIGCTIAPIEAGVMYEIRRKGKVPLRIIAKNQAQALTLYLTLYLREEDYEECI